jgi:hypothetical protein
MDKSIISPEDAHLLLNKLISEKTPVHALLTFPSGARVNFSGFVIRMLPSTGLVLSVALPPARGGTTIAVPIFERNCEFGYVDSRVLPAEGREELVANYGDTVLSCTFTDGDFLGILFNA